MAVTTYSDTHTPSFLSRAGAWFSSVFARMIAAREAQAQRYVAMSLRMADDETLAKLDLTREEVESRPSTPFIY